MPKSRGISSPLLFSFLSLCPGISTTAFNIVNWFSRRSLQFFRIGSLSFCISVKHFDFVHILLYLVHDESERESATASCETWAVLTNNFKEAAKNHCRLVEQQTKAVTFRLWKVTAFSYAVQWSFTAQIDKKENLNFIPSDFIGIQMQVKAVAISRINCGILRLVSVVHHAVLAVFDVGVHLHVVVGAEPCM